jgi:hypothetical protein
MKKLKKFLGFIWHMILPSKKIKIVLGTKNGVRVDYCLFKNCFFFFKYFQIGCTIGSDEVLMQPAISKKFG